MPSVPSGATIRPATVGEAAAVLALWRTADAPPTHTDDVAGIERLLRHDPGALLVADDRGRLVGSVVAGWDGWRGSIHRLVVAPDRRRTGLARRLLAAAEDRLAALGGRRTQAIVVATDADAVGFWSASGWERQADRLRFVRG